jgi:hypothetical protein
VWLLVGVGVVWACVVRDGVELVAFVVVERCFETTR